MNRQCSRTIVAALLVGSTLGLLHAEEHAKEALEHADEAAHSIGDSQSITEHANEALDHLDVAKATHSANSETVKHLEQSEAELNAAVTSARRFNSGIAAEEAEAAREHLQQAQQAADSESGGKTDRR